MTTTNAPGYARFVNALTAQFRALDIPLIPIADPTHKDGLRGNEGWVNFEVVGTGDKVYAKRTRNGDPTVIETTVPFELIPASLVVKDMRDLNGKIEARVKCDVGLIASGLLPVLKARLSAGERLRASKAPVRRASGKAAPASEPVASEPAIQESAGAPTAAELNQGA